MGNEIQKALAIGIYHIVEKPHATNMYDVLAFDLDCSLSSSRVKCH